jgi:DNA polymerase-3 subunit delta
MIIKSFELSKVDLTKNKYFLLYGENEGLKKQSIEEKFKKLYSENIYTYEESEIIKNKESFFNNILTKSFFENEKLIIINRATDKIKDTIEELLEKEIKDLVLILNAGGLEKKSKIRTLFEKNKGIICVPFYEDNDQTLSALVHNFFRKNKVPISQQSINLIVQRSRGDRLNLQNELEKIQSYTQNKTKIEIEELLKLTNLAENYSVSELIDGCLAKNKKKTINILNENNYSLDDCILIIRTFLIKSKRLLRLSQEMKGKKNIEAVISTFKPPIFWKDKEAVKQQVRSWSFINIENLVYRINEVELLIKKNSSNSVNILSDFIIEQATTVSN